MKDITTMMYDRAHVGELVVWNKQAILRNLATMTDGSKWRHEELDCYMTITKMRDDVMGSQCELQCVNDCGLHMTYTVTREEYEDYYEELGDDLFVFASSLQDIGDLYRAPDFEYDFFTDSIEILHRVASGNLPVYRHTEHRVKKGI